VEYLINRIADPGEQRMVGRQTPPNVNPSA
jgi:hypothetical protein